jgi:hypothetical protein
VTTKQLGPIMHASRDNDEGNDAENGIMTRLARTLFANPNSPFTEFADKQRLERIDQCKGLERILMACQSAKRVRDEAREAGMEINETTDAALEGMPASRSGARIARFFKWDNSPDSTDDGLNHAQPAEAGALDRAVSSIYDKGNVGGDDGASKGKKSIVRPRFSEDCAIETHEMWACRALALGCGNHLDDLRRCWSDKNPITAVVTRRGDDGMDFHEDPKKDEKKSCRGIQISMARCVNRHAAELNERVRSSSSAAGRDER